MMKTLRGERVISAYVIPAIVVVLLSPIVFWIMDSTPPRIVTDITPLNEPRPGEVLLLRFTGEAYRNCPATVQEWLIDVNKHVKVIAPRSGVIDRDPGRFAVTVEVTTPLDMTPGPALYRSKVLYYCNPWQRYVFPLTVERRVEFTVREPLVSGDTPFQFYQVPLSTVQRSPSLE